MILIGPRPPAATTIECVASGVLVDPAPADDARHAVCPACGVLTWVGGWPVRFLAHREPGERAASERDRGDV